VLDYACFWTAAAHDADAAATAITREMYALGLSVIRYGYVDGGGLDFVDSPHYTCLDPFDVFECSLFFDRLRGGLRRCTGCRLDPRQALGCDLWQSPMGYSFALNPILAIGSSRSERACGNFGSRDTLVYRTDMPGTHEVVICTSQGSRAGTASVQGDPARLSLTAATATQAAAALGVRLGTRSMPRLRLIGLPYAGGGPGIFRQWPAHLPGGVDVYAVESPGRERLADQPPMHDLAALTARIAPAVQACLDLPFVLFGHSMGALLAFELARRLPACGPVAPSVSMVSGHRPPQLPNRREAARAATGRVPCRAGTAARDAAEVLNNSELLELCLPLLRADFELSETYRYAPGTPLHCPIIAFGGRSDTEVGEEEIAAWSAQTEAAFHMLSGDHFFLLPSRPRSRVAAFDRIGVGALSNR
jgi:medium-chain acyl-[acyl-carrier-protein] hydrolase